VVCFAARGREWKRNEIREDRKRGRNKRWKRKHPSSESRNKFLVTALNLALASSNNPRNRPGCAEIFF